MVYELDLELPIYEGNNCSLRFNHFVRLQGVPINYFEGNYKEVISQLGRQFKKLKKAGEDVKIYVNGDFVDLSKSPVLKGVLQTKDGVSNLLSSDFMNVKKSSIVRVIKKMLKRKDLEDKLLD